MSSQKPSVWYIVAQRLRGKSFLYEFYFKNKRTLDIGCGEGEFLRINPEHLHGVDANVRTVENLQRKGYKVTLGSALKLPYAHGEFEAVHCRNVIEHLDAPGAYTLIQEAARVLQSGGIFVVASEVVTKKFWETFGHIKPYPPAAIVKLLRRESREEFEAIATLEYVTVFYFGDFFKNRGLYVLALIIAWYTPFWRREYFLILRKK